MKRVPNGVTIHRRKGRLLRRTLSIAVVFAIALVGSSLFSPGALAAPAPYAYSNGFENVNDTSPPAPGTSTEAVIGATRTASNSAGITASSGAWYGQAATGSGAFTRFGGYSGAFPTGGYTTSINIYLDMTAAATLDQRFDWSSAISTPSGAFRRDFVFNAGTNGVGFVIAGSNNAGRSGANPFVAADQYLVTTTGWYTFEHHFYDGGAGVLAVDLNLRDASGTLLHTWTRSDPTDIIGSTVGGNRYGWLVNNELPLALDDVTRSGIPESADLSITKTDSPDPVVAGNDLTYTITVSNAGPSDAQNVQVTDVLPSELTGAKFCVTAGCDPATGASWTSPYSIGTLAANNSVVIKIIAKVKADTTGGTERISNTASVSSPTSDPDTADRTATAKTDVTASADLSITKTDSPDPVHIGQKLTYTITVTNNGPDQATGVTLQDDFPKTTGFGSVSSTQGSCSRSKTRVTCILGTMASGSTATVTLVVKPTQKGTITNTVTVSATSPADPNTANNTATQTTLVKP
jgi:uncharacterized repeat protein (TIGR01451 family)